MANIAIITVDQSDAEMKTTNIKTGAKADAIKVKKRNSQYQSNYHHECSP